MRINKHDTQGTKPLLGKGELGYDDYDVGGDAGRVYVGTGNENIPLAKKSEVMAVDSKADAHIAKVDNPHGVTKAQVGLGNVDNTADSTKNVLSATKWTTARTFTLSGDVVGSASVDGSANVTITTTVQPNSVALGTDTTGNYVAGITQGTGITVSGTAGEGWSPTIAITNVGTAGTYTKVTTNAQGQVTSGTTLSTVDIPSLDASKITTGTLPVVLGGTGVTTSTGTGSVVLSTSPILTTPNIGVATGTSFNSITGLSSVAPLIAGTAAVGTSTTVARQDHVHPAQTSVTGNAGTATTLQTARTIGASGDVTGTATSFNGSANITIPMTLANSGVTAGTYSKVTVDAKGRVTAGLTPTMEDIPDATFKRSVRCATTANITLSGTQTIDGIAVVAGDRVLVKNQTTTSQNGIYVVAASTWTRALDANSSSKIASAIVAVDSGTVNGGKLFDNDFKTTDTLDTTSMLWNMNIDDGSLLTAGSTSVGMVKYNGTTATAGNFDGGTITPTGTTRLNYGGYFYPTYLNLVGSVDTTTASSHVFVETGTDGFVRPKTLANFKTEIFASPTLVTPNIGVATGTSFNSITGLSATTPLMNGTAAVGTSATVARADHVHPVDTSRAPLVSPAFTGTPTVNGYNISQFTGFKNYIINGNFDVWQRDTSFNMAYTGQGVYHADRFSSASTFSVGSVSITKSSITYNNITYNSAKCTTTTAYTTSGVQGAYRHFCYYLEGIDSSVVNKGFTLSFLFNTNTAGTYTVSFRCEGNITSAYKTRITAVSGIQKMVITVPANTITIPNLDNNLGLQIYIGGVAGSLYTGLSTTLNQWDSSVTALYYPNEMNWAGTVGNYIEIAQVQLEEGSVATPFENRPIGLELSLCQRYYQQFISDGADGELYSHERTSATSPGIIYVTKTIPFKVKMRTTPSVTIIRVYNQGTDYDTDWCVYLTGLSNGNGGISIYKNISVTAGQAIAFDVTASAEL